MGILRMVWESGGRYGAQVLLDALRGSSAQKVKQFGLDRLSVYGALRGTPMDMLRKVLHKLYGMQLLKQQGDPYPVVKITPEGKELLLEEVPISITVQVEKKEIAAKKKGSKKAVSDAGDHSLFEVLRSLRMALARKQGVPPYLVFSDKTLTDMCRKLPENKEEMLNVTGVGEKKFELYGDSFLEEIRKYRETDSVIE